MKYFASNVYWRIRKVILMSPMKPRVIFPMVLVVLLLGGQTNARAWEFGFELLQLCKVYETRTKENSWNWSPAEGALMQNCSDRVIEILEKKGATFCNGLREEVPQDCCINSGY